MSEMLLVKGINGQVVIVDNRIEITRIGFKSFASHGFDGTKTIFLKKLTGIQFKEAGKMTNGFIQFIFPGSTEDKGGLFSAVKDENTVIFNQSQQNDFEKLRDFIFKNV